MCINFLYTVLQYLLYFCCIFNEKNRINAGNLFRYIPSEHSSYYDNSGSYYNLMTESKHNVEEPRVVEKQIEQLLEEEV